MGPRCLKAGVPMAALMALYIYGQVATGPEQSSGSAGGRHRRAPRDVAKSCNVRSSVVRNRGIESGRGGAWAGVRACSAAFARLVECARGRQYCTFQQERIQVSAGVPAESSRASATLTRRSTRSS